ncbi:fatty acid desaturase [Gordonia aurantiaca]|uniref:fatty acid desaturase n=1 Tax=Gordonia sp. B21 TaxID=3151852 RepID=UPI00326309E6
MATPTASPVRDAPHQALPDPGERIPVLSWPIVGIFSAAIALFVGSTWAAVTDTLPAVVTILLSATSIFVLFTVLHDASHHSVSTHRWVNAAFGRVAMFFVSPLISFKSFAFIHIEHHRNTNDGDNDPDHFVSGAPRWQVPFRFALMDVPYLSFWLRNVRRRPTAEVVETSLLLVTSVAVLVGCTLTGHLWTLALVYLIPERVAMFVLAWWFDWLPHHDLADTQQENRYRATRNRVGAEWILTPLLLSQNYHLVHHLHPSIPFHRYVAAWRRNEDAYLERDAAISTAFGRELTPEEYREWKQLNAGLAPVLPLRNPPRAISRAGRFHALPIAAVDRLTADSVRIRFDVPEHLRDVFAFDPGQHVTVRATIDGEVVRRTYSICSSPTSGDLSIGVKRVAGGVFSTFAVERLRAGDVLELSSPAGSFGAAFDPLAEKSYVAIAVGSGITPIRSILETALALEATNRFTLIYGNRDAETTMFRAELEDLATRHPRRLRIVDVRSRDTDHPESLRGRIDRARLNRWLDTEIPAASVDDWFLCGPVDMVTGIRDTLLSRGVDSEHVHVEVFTGRTPSHTDGFARATVTVGLDGRQRDIELAAGDTVLEATLKSGLDAPYACLGGACGTCTARLTQGTVDMEQNFALSPAEVADGFILTCQSRPTSDSITVDYEG